MRELSPGELIAGKFRLQRVVGRGGMGSVWAARHEQLGMLVALKFIEADEGTDLADARARFEREARAAAQIRSPHVAQIIDHGVDGDRPFIAMELLEGEDLGQRLRREGRISLAAAARILSGASKALRRAHEAGIIHRDLKPGNIFLARFDDDEVVKLLDFGVAKVRSAGVLDGPMATQMGIVFGSPSYMSPEQARGVRALDHRSDLWSLAVIVFRSITGSKPFEAASIGDLVVKLCIDPLPVATRFAPDLPPEVDAFFERAFARDPDQRFSSAVELAAAFEAIAARVPDDGRRPATLPPGNGVGPASSSGPSLIAARPIVVPRPAPATSPMARAPAQQLPPAPPLSVRPGALARAAAPALPSALWPAAAPAATPPAPPPAATAAAPPPAAGSGPQVAFAPGTLTPPPRPALTTEPLSPAHARGEGPAAPPSPGFAPIPAAPPSASRAAPSPAGPPPPTPPPPPAPGVAGPPPTPARPRMIGGTTMTFAAVRAPDRRRRLVVGAVLGGAVIGVLAVVLVFAAVSGGADPGARPAASAPPPAVASERAPAPALPSASAPAAPADPAPSGAAAPSADPTPTGDPGPTADPAPAAQPAPGASAAPEPSSKPRGPVKHGKKRPNFGY
jgi:serine/threonine-protein kinase